MNSPLIARELLFSQTLEIHAFSCEEIVNVQLSGTPNVFEIDHLSGG